MIGRGNAYFAAFIFVVLVVLAALAFVGMVGYVIYYYFLAGLLARTRRTMATVVRKHQREYDLDLPAYGGGSKLLGMSTRIGALFGRDTPDLPVYASTDFFMVFRFDGREQEFKVPQSVYAQAYEGDRGLLVYKGTLFRHFIGGVGG